jgi:hypothetical protein
MNRREIDEINFIHVLGIDYSEKEYVLTAVYSASQGADAEKTDAGEEEISQGKGATPFEAFQDLKLKTRRRFPLPIQDTFL